jgi:type II secretory pathway pseudopilin PulG
MAKKNISRYTQSPSVSTAVLVTILIIAFITALAVYVWQKGKADMAEKNLTAEINSIKNQITLTQNEKPADNSGVTVQPKTETAPDNEFDPNMEVKFSKCGVAGAFRLEAWYPAFTEKLKTLNLVPKNVTSACFSDSGKMFIFIAQPGAYCEGPKVYRYNMITTNIAAAEVLNKGVTCLGSLKEFGKRNGNVIGAIAPGGDGGCRREEHYNYDFIKNIVELIKSRSLCDGDKEWKWTEY